MNWMKGGQNSPQNVKKDPTRFTLPNMQKGTYLDMYAFLNEREYTPRFDMTELVWSENGIRLAEHDPRNISINYEPSVVGETVRAGGRAEAGTARPCACCVPRSCPGVLRQLMPSSFCRPH